jgi:hypothetical protein
MRRPRTNSSFDTTMPETLPLGTSPHTRTIVILLTESFFHLPPLRSSPLCKKRQLASGVTHNSRSPTRSEKATHQTTDLKPGDWSTVYSGACSAIPPRRTTVRGPKFEVSGSSNSDLHPSAFTPLSLYPSRPTPFTPPSRHRPRPSRVLRFRLRSHKKSLRGDVAQREQSLIVGQQGCLQSQRRCSHNGIRKFQSESFSKTHSVVLDGLGQVGDRNIRQEISNTLLL